MVKRLPWCRYFLDRLLIVAPKLRAHNSERCAEPRWLHQDGRSVRLDQAPGGAHWAEAIQQRADAAVDRRKIRIRGICMKKVFWCIVTGAILVALAGCGTGLIVAAKKGDVATMQRLLDQGANINEGALSGNCSGPPLAHAAYHCQPESVRYLVNKGADIEAVGVMMAGHRPLHLAAREDCVEAVKILLDAGADINVRANDRYGSALAMAALSGNIKTLKYLIERGADVDDAITVLRKWGDDDGLALLEKYGEPIVSAGPRSKELVAPLISSDVDAIPDLKAAPRSEALAIVIGIESYQALPKSEYSKSDALTVKGYLKALGFQERNIELIVDQRATKSAFEKAVEAWLPNQTTKDSTIFVYFSGHGAPEPATGEAYMVPYDGDPNYLAVTGYSLKRLYEQLGKLKAREIIVVLDSCFSGAGGRSVLAKGARPLVMMAATGTLSANMAVLTATEGGQISTSSSEKGHGVFTYYFLKAIKEGKKDLAEIYETITPQVEDEAKQLNVQQSPSLTPDTDTVKGRFRLRK